MVGIALGTALVFGVFAVADAEANGTTPEFIALAERSSGKQLDDVFDTWLYTGEKPPPVRPLIPFCAYNSVGYREQVRAQRSHRGSLMRDGSDSGGTHPRVLSGWSSSPDREERRRARAASRRARAG